MDKIMFRVSKSDFSIVPILVVRETDKTLWVKKDYKNWQTGEMESKVYREARDTGYDITFELFQDAKEYALREARKEKNRIDKRLHENEKKIAELEQLTDPTIP